MSARVVPAEALAELRRGAGSQFDPAVVEIVFDIVEPRPGWHASRSCLRSPGYASGVFR